MKTVEKTKGIAITGAVGLGIIVLCTGGYFLIKSNCEHLALENETVTVNLDTDGGYLKVGDFVGNKMSSDAIESITTESSLNEKEAKAGSYDITFKYKPLLGEEETVQGKLILEDTTAPKFIGDYEKLTVEQDVDDLAFEKFFTITDKSEYSVHIEAKSVKLNKAGRYKIKVIVTDDQGNKTVKEVTVQVVPSKDVWDGKEKLSEYTDGTVPMTEETRKHEELKAEEEARKRAEQAEHEDQEDQNNTEDNSQPEQKVESTTKDPIKNPSELKHADGKKEEYNGTGIKVYESKEGEKITKDRNGTDYLDVDDLTPCEKTVPSTGVIGKARTERIARDYLKSNGLDKTHTYELQELETECGQVYYTFSIVAKE